MSLSFSKFIQYTTVKVNPNANHGLWGIMMHQCRFISCNKGPTLLGDIGSGGRVPVGLWGAGVSCGETAPAAQYCSESKNALKCKDSF